MKRATYVYVITEFITYVKSADKTDFKRLVGVYKNETEAHKKEARLNKKWDKSFDTSVHKDIWVDIIKQKVL